MRYQTFELQKADITVDGLGNRKENWIKVDDISVCISVKSIESISKDVLYIVENTMGLTKYSNLNKNTKYRLVHNDEIYRVDTILFGRFNQLSLVKVVK